MSSVAVALLPLELLSPAMNMFVHVQIYKYPVTGFCEPSQYLPFLVRILSPVSRAGPRRLLRVFTMTGTWSTSGTRSASGYRDS